MNCERYNRNILFFGKAGQERLTSASVAVIGIGGLGSHVVQQLALLGIGKFILIDPEEIDKTNRNRYIGVRDDDPIPGTPKVAVGERLVHELNRQIDVVAISEPLVSHAAFEAIKECDYVFGCLDNEGARLILNELCSAYAKPYIDLASGILIEGSRYGGRVCVAWNGNGCLSCYDVLDVAEARDDLMGTKERSDHKAIYGIPEDALGEVGPSVVSINGVIASLGVTEFMLLVTGVRSEPRGLLKYHGDRGIVSVAIDIPTPDCYYCSGIRGKGDNVGMHRYLSSVKEDYRAINKK